MITQNDHAPGALEGLAQRVDLIKREVDELQIQASQERTPWHRNPPVLLPIVISILAFAFSAWSGWQAEERIERQDQHAARTELRGLIQRLQAMPREYYEIQRDYADDPATRGVLASSLNAEGQVLAQQAVELIDQLEGQVSASEYATTAYVLATSGHSVRADDLLARGLAVANDAVTETALLRQVGNARFAAGDLEGGRQAFEQALRIFEKYPERNAYTISSTQAFTEYHWTTAALAQRQCGEAWEHLRRATSYASSLAPNDPVRSQVESTPAVIEASCGPAS